MTVGALEQRTICRDLREVWTFSWMVVHFSIAKCESDWRVRTMLNSGIIKAF